MKNSTKALIGVLLAGTAGLLIFLFVHLSNDPTRPITIGAQKAAACTKGEHCLPDVTFTDVNGTHYTHASLLGKVVVINFWATWCKPCEHEIPDLSRVYDKYKGQGLVILGVMTDDMDSQGLLNFQSDHEMSYPVVRANSDIMVSFSYPSSLPTTYVFDRGGKQVSQRVGAMREKQLLDLIDPLIAQN
jgi:thiol-disulfide isomerase/thioredoxin